MIPFGATQGRRTIPGLLLPREAPVRVRLTHYGVVTGNCTALTHADEPAPLLALILK